MGTSRSGTEPNQNVKERFFWSLEHGTEQEFQASLDVFVEADQKEEENINPNAFDIEAFEKSIQDHLEDLKKPAIQNAFNELLRTDTHTSISPSSERPKKKVAAMQTASVRGRRMATLASKNR